MGSRRVCWRQKAVLCDDAVSLRLVDGLVTDDSSPLQVVAYDFGIKQNILRRLASFGCKLTVVPANYPAEKALALKPDGVFFSNGPVGS